MRVVKYCKLELLLLAVLNVVSYTLLNLADDADIMKQTRDLYARANTIIRKFSAALHQTAAVQSILYSIIWLSALVLHVSVLIS